MTVLGKIVLAAIGVLIIAFALWCCVSINAPRTPAELEKSLAEESAALAAQKERRKPK